MLETMPEEELKEIQNFIQYIIFRDAGTTSLELLSEDMIVSQLTQSMERSDMGNTTLANIASQRMKEKYVL